MINHSSKILLYIICQWLKLHLHWILSQEQVGFQEHRSTVKQIFTLWQLVEKHGKRQNKRIAQAFIDYKKCVWLLLACSTLPSPRSLWHPYKVSQPSSQPLQQSFSAVKCNGHVGVWCRTTVGSRQGNILSPDPFSIYIENIMSLALEKTVGVGVLVSSHLFSNLLCADDIALLAGSGRRFATPVRLSQLS